MTKFQVVSIDNDNFIYTLFTAITSVCICKVFLIYNICKINSVTVTSRKNYITAKLSPFSLQIIKYYHLVYDRIELTSMINF